MSRKSRPAPDQTAPITLCDWEDQPSPYYTDKHKRFRKYCRDFVDKHILPNVDKWEKEGDLPKEFYKLCYDYGLYSTNYPSFVGGTPFEGDESGGDEKSFSTQHDPFMNMICYEEMCRCASGGLLGAVWIHYLGVAPVMIFGNPKLQQMMLPVIKAEKYIALAVSEPQAGSDVRNITTTAKLDGDNYIVNGEKYWITGGIKADYFVTAVRTGGRGIFGISLMLIPRSKGVHTTRLPLQGHNPSATAYVVFKDVKVPKDHIIGKVNQGFQPLVYNFNHERFGIITQAIGLSRVCVNEAAAYARSRKTFGKYMIHHQVIRHKLANMSRKVLSVHAFQEWCAYRMSQDSFGIGNRSLVKDISLLKVEATQCLEFCAREAAQIFGGRAYVRGGRAAKIERIWRDVRALAVYGGSEEIMLDLAIRQAKL